MEAIVSKYKDKVVFVDLWATWCGPCIEASGKIKKVKEQFAKNLELLTEENSYNYVAYLMNDINNISIKVARYEGLTRVKLVESNVENSGCGMLLQYASPLSICSHKNYAV